MEVALVAQKGLNQRRLIFEEHLQVLCPSRPGRGEGPLC